MNTKLLSPRFFRTLTFATLAAPFLASGVIVACSSATSGEDASCAALQSCCVTVPGESSASCQQTVQAAQATSTSCAQLLQSYQNDGYCGGTDGGGSSGSSSSPGVATGSCVQTGACDAGTGSPSTGPTDRCDPLGECSNGVTYETCVQTNAAGACSASIVFSDGSQLACASCTDCAAASASAALACGSPTTGDDGGAQTVDSGPVCGTPPVLHPETVPGVYCPFTAVGAVHCLAGQQCCEAPEGSVSSCQPAGAACPVVGSITWGCVDPLDCQGNDAGAVCCATGATTFDSACGFNRGTGFTGSQCATSCGAGQIAICSAANDPCVSPAQCTPFKVEGLVMGACL